MRRGNQKGMTKTYKNRNKNQNKKKIKSKNKNTKNGGEEGEEGEEEGLEEEVGTGAVVNPTKAHAMKWAYSRDVCSCQAAVWTRGAFFCMLSPA